MTKPRNPSLLTRIIHAGADHFVRSAQVPAENRMALRDTFISVMEWQFSAFAAGEQLRLSIPRMPRHAAQQRRQRILASLEQGLDPAFIARREGVSVRWVQRLHRSAVAGQRGPEQETKT